MLREITIGQYYPADSILHKLDPRVKFLGTIVFIVSLFLVKGAAGYALVTVCLAALIILSKVPFKFMVKGMKAIFFVLIITMLFNLFLTPGEIIGRWWIFKVTREGIVQAVRMGIRLTYLVIVGIIDHDLHLTWLISHVVPTQAITIQTLSRVLCYLALTLAIDKELSRGIVGIAIDRRHLSYPAFTPCPMWQQVYGVLLRIPMRTIEEVAVFGKTCQVADAKIAAA